MRHRIVVVLMVLGCTPSAGARRAPDQAEGAAIDTARIRGHVEVLAHDSMRGRATPSRELEAAARYVASELTTAGLRPVFDHPITRYPVLELERDSAATALSSTAGVIPLGRGAVTRSGATGPQGVRAPLVILRGDPSSAASIAPEQVRGHVALVILPPPRTGIGNAFWTLFRSLPASPLAFLIVTEPTDSAWQARLRATLAPRFAVPADTGVTLPVVEIRPEHAQRLIGEPVHVIAALEESGDALTATPVPGLEVEVRAPMRVVREHAVPNVAVFLPGSDPASGRHFVVVSAHLDHLGVASDGDVYNGADDNASGVATALEVARVAARSAAPERPVLFLFPSGEEDGLWGSRAFVERLLASGAVPVANLNLDMLGRNAPDTVHLVGEDASDLDDWVRRAAAEGNVGLDLAPDAWPNADFFSRSDQLSFHEHGIPGLFIFAGPHADYHQTSDDPGTLDYGKLGRVGQLVLRSVVLLADSSAVPALTP